MELFLLTYNWIIQLQDRQTKELEIGLSVTDLSLYLQTDYLSPRILKTKKKGRIFFIYHDNKKKSLLFKIKLENEKNEFQVNDFIDFFLEGGLFESLLDKIFGIATHNFNLNIYNVTSKESTPKSLIEDLYETFKDPQEISIKNDIDCLLQINRPLGYRQLITLYSMPFDINLDHLKTITNKWGILKHF